METVPDIFKDNEIFEQFSHQNGMLYWYASDLMEILGYEDYKPTMKPIQKALQVCMSTNIDTSEAIREEWRTIDGKSIKDFKISRFACYLITMNADIKKPNVAKFQAYFAAQKYKPLYTGSEEMGANMFRITQTEAKLKREGINGQAAIESVINTVDNEVRSAIKQIGGSDMSIEQIQQELDNLGVINIESLETIDNGFLVDCIHTINKIDIEALAKEVDACIASPCK